VTGCARQRRNPATAANPQSALLRLERSFTNYSAILPPPKSSLRSVRILKSAIDPILFRNRSALAGFAESLPNSLELTPVQCSGSAALSSRTRSRCEAGQTVAAVASIQNGLLRLRPIKGLQWQTVVRGDIGRQRLFPPLANPGEVEASVYFVHRCAMK
jgi:hypothetical protein